MRFLDLHFLVQGYVLEHSVVPVIISVQQYRRPELDNLRQMLFQPKLDGFCEESTYVFIHDRSLIESGNELLYICYCNNVIKIFFQINCWIVSTNILLSALRVVNQILYNYKKRIITLSSGFRFLLKPF